MIFIKPLFIELNGQTQFFKFPQNTFYFSYRRTLQAALINTVFGTGDFKMQGWHLSIKRIKGSGKLRTTISLQPWSGTEVQRC